MTILYTCVYGPEVHAMGEYCLYCNYSFVTWIDIMIMDQIDSKSVCAALLRACTQSQKTVKFIRVLIVTRYVCGPNVCMAQFESATKVKNTWKIN